jgi:tight adherence protein C
MQLAIALLVFITLITFMTAFQKHAQPVKVDLQGRLKNVMPYDEIADTRQAELSVPLSERLVSPFLSLLSGLASKLLPKEMLQSLEKKVERSGRRGGFSARDYLGMKVIFAFVLPFLIYLLNKGQLEAITILLMGITLIIGWKFPDMQLDTKARKRMATMEKSFPDVMDLLTVSVEAGLGFDGALVKVVEKSKGPVAEEFRRVLHEIKMGKTRREALRDFAERSGVDDIHSFTGAIIQSDQLGLNIGKTLKNQAEQMRRKRRQRIEEKAMKVPVKMLIPMILFIFPTIFVVLLGPALLMIMQNLVVL